MVRYISGSKAWRVGIEARKSKTYLKETVVHTLLDDQPLFPPRTIGQGNYGDIIRGAMNHNRDINHIQDEVQKVTVLKREQDPVEEGQLSKCFSKQPVKNQQREKDQKKEKSNAVLSNLVNYSG